MRSVREITVNVNSFPPVFLAARTANEILGRSLWQKTHFERRPLALDPSACPVHASRRPDSVQTKRTVTRTDEVRDGSHNTAFTALSRPAQSPALPFEHENGSTDVLSRARRGYFACFFLAKAISALGVG